MANFDSGVKSFVVAECEIQVKFPVDWQDRSDICCAQCPYLSGNEKFCQLNKQPVHYPRKYVGFDCPLKIKNEGE